MNFKLTSILLFGVLLFAACDDDDGGITLPTYDCAENPDNTGCQPVNLMGSEELRNAIIGDWRVLATGCGDCANIVFCEATAASATFSFTFTADGVYRYELPNGEAGEGTYEVVETPCLSCGPRIDYTPADLGYIPFFSFFCGDDDAFHDDRPLDGTLGVYRRM